VSVINDPTILNLKVLTLLGVKVWAWRWRFFWAYFHRFSNI